MEGQYTRGVEQRAVILKRRYILETFQYLNSRLSSRLNHFFIHCEPYQETRAKKKNVSRKAVQEVADNESVEEEKIKKLTNLFTGSPTRNCVEF